MTTQNHHYFASCAFGFYKADTREEAIKGLLHHFKSSIKDCVKNSHKEGSPGFYLWSCRVDQAERCYTVAWYAPENVEVSDSSHHFVTYMTNKQFAYYSTLDGKIDGAKGLF